MSPHTATSSLLLKKLLTDYVTTGRLPVKKNTQWNLDSTSDSAYIRQSKVLEIVPFSSATLWRKCKAGTFPKPVKLSERVTAWRCGDVRKWLANQTVGAV